MSILTKLRSIFTPSEHVLSLQRDLEKAQDKITTLIDIAETFKIQRDVNKRDELYCRSKIEELLFYKRNYNKLSDLYDELKENYLYELDYGYSRGKTTESTPQFSKDEISSMLRLCHPDKHSGKQSATTITQKLIKIRGTL